MNHLKFTNPTWDPNYIPWEADHHFHLVHQLPSNHAAVWTDYPLQNPCTPSSSSTALVGPTSLTNQKASSNLKTQEHDHQEDEEEEEEEELGAMKEMMFKIAAMQPVEIDLVMLRKPKRQNVRISDDPQSVAARHRRERISEKIRILQRRVPGGTKMDTASMLDEAIRYVKFLKRQIRLLQANYHQTSIEVPSISTQVWAGAGSATTTSAATMAGTPYAFAGNYGVGGITPNSFLLVPTAGMGLTIETHE